jgi:hypothetical protein
LKKTIFLSVILSISLFASNNKNSECISMKENLPNIYKVIGDAYSIIHNKKTKCEELSNKDIEQTTTNPIYIQLMGLNELIIETNGDTKSCLAFSYDLIIKKALERKITTNDKLQDLIQNEYAKEANSLDFCKKANKDLEKNVETKPFSDKLETLK